MTEATLVKEKKFLKGWPLGLWDGVVVLGFSFAPLLFRVGTILIYPRHDDPNRDTISRALEEYFSGGDIIFVALAVAGSVAAKVWLDIRYRQYSNLKFNATIIACGLIAAMVQTGKILDYKPDVPMMILFSMVLIMLAMATYVWLIANPPEDQVESVSKTFDKAAIKLAGEIKALQQGEKQ